ncbi:MAG: hypothetical protein ACHQQ3_08450 [Gemmatimonadales bacterium]
MSTHRIQFGGCLLSLLLVAANAFAQGGRGEAAHGKEQPRTAVSEHKGGEHGVGKGHVPAHGPAPLPAGRREVAPAPTLEQEGHPLFPHVHAEDDRWIGHGIARRDARLHLDHPWEHGRFVGGIGRRHIWRMHGGGRERFEVDGYLFRVTPYEYDYVRDWAWDSDDIVIFLDPDHDGWYLGYNVRLGTYVHIVYLGG